MLLFQESDWKILVIRNNNKSISNGGSGQSTLKGLANMHNVVQKSENIYLDVVDLFILYFTTQLCQWTNLLLPDSKIVPYLFI